MPITKSSALAVVVAAALGFAAPSAKGMEIGGAHPHRALSMSPPAGRSPQIIPPDPRAGGSGSSGGAAPGGELGESDGVIRPPSGVDPGMAQSPPKLDQRSTPVLPLPVPPGAAK